MFKYSFYLNFKVELFNGSVIEIRETKKKDKKIGSNVFWDIIVEGEKRGEIQNDLSWKNTRALKEKTILRYGETYYYSSFVIGSETKIENH